jgi:hypothetical protein
MITQLSIHRLPQPPRWAGEVLAGFAYWAAFLLVLEPGNILRAHQAGRELSIGHEALRIAAASCLGAMATPPALWLSRRLMPFRTLPGPVILLSGMAGLSVMLILTSCLLAAWVFKHTWLPTMTDIGNVLTGNGLLVLFALLAQCALDRAFAPLRSAPIPRPSPVNQIAVKTRSGQLIVDVDTIDWIESQGNYLALHTGASVHLVRDTMAALAARLDPDGFVRVHRGTVVAINRITGIDTFDNGDGLAQLRDGTQVKVSRTYRKALRDRWK